jgi:hypothetical protein
MDNTDNDRHLHLERVRKDQGIVGTVPVRVNTERIHLAIGNGRNRALSVVWPVETVGEDVQRLGEDIVVDESSEYRKGTHQQDQVSSTMSSAFVQIKEAASLQEECFDVLIDSRTSDLLFENTHGKSS